jgi:hypothetical protein
MHRSTISHNQSSLRNFGGKVGQKKKKPNEEEKPRFRFTPGVSESG